jgi:hypothetical protein
MKLTSANGKAKVLLVYSYNELNLLVSNEQGKIKVCKKGSETGLSRVYVKVFAKMNNGQSAFYRDGYTDVAGGFNYFDVKTSSIASITQFAVFVDHRDLGTLT